MGFGLSADLRPFDHYSQRAVFLDEQRSPIGGKWKPARVGFQAKPPNQYDGRGAPKSHLHEVRLMA